MHIRDIFLKQNKVNHMYVWKYLFSLKIVTVAEKLIRDIYICNEIIIAKEGFLNYAEPKKNIFGWGTIKDKNWYGDVKVVVGVLDM